MQSIPAICLNPKCGTIFPGSKLIGFENSNCKSIQIEGNISAGACPSCGEKSKVVNGVYRIIENELFGTIQQFDDLILLQKALQIIQKDLVRAKSPKNIKKKLKKKFPKQHSLWRIIPETKMEACVMIQAIAAIIMAIIAIGSCFKEDKAIILNQTYQNLYSQEHLSPRQNNPSNNHIVPSTRPNKLIDL